MKKILFLFAALWFMTAFPVAAQSMTDDQLIQFIIQEKEKGTSQENIVKAVLQKGVTPEQLQRVRRKVESEMKQGKSVTQTGDLSGSSRLRTRQGREEEGLLLDSMDIYVQQQDNTKQVFGRNIFNQKNLSFEPNMNMATPANYRLGAGDVLIIDVWGASQETFQKTVSPDGTVTIEGVGPIKVGGLSVSEATSRLKSRLGQYYADCKISLSLGETRSIIVQVMGEVVMPGTYTLSSLSSAFNALYAAGGISDVGTLRDIKVYRSGRIIARIDVYDYLINGNTKGDVRLQDNDVIIVGAYDCLVQVQGKVKRPMYYEMKSTESVLRVLEFAGGFTGDAYTKSVRLIRHSGQEYSIHNIEEFQMNGFTLCDGDSIFVDRVTPRFSNMVTIRGAVMHPGQYQMDGGIQTVRDLLRAAEGLREDAFTERAVMHREKEDLTLEMIAVDLKGIMDGRIADVSLKKNDVLFIPGKSDLVGERTLRINGEVHAPGVYDYADNTTIKDLILQAGGLTRAASTAKIDVFRRLYLPDAKEASDALSQVFTFTLDNGFIVEDTAFVLQPFDEVQVRKSPVYAEQQNVTITGSVNFEGQYAMTSKDFRLSDLIKLAGGLSDDAYSKGARLMRQMTPEERIQREKALRSSQISLMETGLVNESFNYDKAEDLMEMKMDLDNDYGVAIDLEDALAHPKGESDIVLRANDRLIVPQYSAIVKIAGEVMHPISVSYKKGESLKYYINHAGGYTKQAYKKGNYAIYLNGSVEKLGRRPGSKKIAPGSEIMVPTKPKREGMTPAEITVLGTSAASLTTMIVALVNLLK